MALNVTLIGAAGAGKTATFDALVATPEGPHFTTKGGHRLGTVKVPDARLEKLRDMFKPKKFIPAEITFVDVAMPAGEAKGFSQLNAMLGEADAFALVVQAFGDTDGAGKPLDPAAQLETVASDLAVADLEKIERREEKINAELKKGQKQNAAELAALVRCREAIERGETLRAAALSEEEEKLLSSFRFLSQKPLLVIANVAEGETAAPAPLVEAAKKLGAEVLAFSAPLEAEIASLPEAEQAAFMQDYGLSEPARRRLIRLAYRTLKLASFFTVGPDEVRAWTIREGDTAVVAAGKIHTDFARGFIRAETVASETLLEKGSYAACREAGVLRLEGKGYVVQDGDVLEIRANG